VILQAVTGRKIAVLLPDLRPGGAEKLHVNLAAEWQAKGIEVDFVVRQARGELLASLPPGVGVIDLQAARVRNLFWPLVRYLREAKPDVLLTAMWPSTVLAACAARFARFGGRVVVSEHSPLSLAYAGRGRLHRLFLKLSQRFGYPLSDARIADLARLSGLPRDNFIVLHNPAALGVGHTVPAAPGALLGAVPPIILSVGTLKRVKRQDLLISAFAAMPAAQRGTLVILGEGPERGVLEELVGQLDLAGSVRLPGHAAEPAAWYAQADMFVLSSDYEGFGNVLVEAMEFGLPIVSTDCVAGPAEILSGGRYGRLVPTGDVLALAQAMLEMLHAPVDADALRARAAEFALDVVAVRYLDVLFPGWRAVVPA
jgi:glycosyltransferase involved in cell wall biosynthesis